MDTPTTQTGAARFKNAVFQVIVITSISLIVNLAINMWRSDDRMAKYQEAFMSDLEVGLMAFSEATMSHENGTLRHLTASDAKQMQNGFQLSLDENLQSASATKPREVMFDTKEKLDHFVDFYNRCLEIKVKNEMSANAGDSK